MQNTILTRNGNLCAKTLLRGDFKVCIPGIKGFTMVVLTYLQWIKRNKRGSVVDVPSKLDFELELSLRTPHSV